MGYLASPSFIFSIGLIQDDGIAMDGILCWGGGLFCGFLALILELHLFQKVEFWPKPLALYFARQMACGIAFLTLSFALANSVTMVVHFLPSGIPLVSFLVIPLMAALYLPLIAPFGAIVGLINGVLFRIAHISQVHERVVNFP